MKTLCTSARLALAATSLTAATLSRGQDKPSIPAAYASVVAASNDRRDRALAELNESRSTLESLTSRKRKVETQIEHVAHQLGAATSVDIQTRTSRLEELRTRAKSLDTALKTLKSSAYQSSAHLLAYDQATDDQRALKSQMEAAAREVASGLRLIARGNPEGAALAREWEGLEEQVIATANEVVLAQGRRDASGRAEAGLLKRLSTESNAGSPSRAPVVRINVPPPPNSIERLARFEGRNSPAGLRQLAERFFSQMTLSHPGLEEVQKRVREDDLAGALDAYKEHFFRVLLSPSARPNASATGDDEERRDGDSQPLPPPTEEQIEQALAGVVVENFPTGGNPRRFAAPLGQPGSINWVFADHVRADKDLPADVLLDFCRRLGYPGMTGVSLLMSYVIGGPQEHLIRWSEILDDWSMNWQEAVERSPLPVRDYNLLYVCRIQSVRDRLKVMAEMRPSLVKHLPAATLARWLMAMNEEYLASAIRLGRSGLYNFRIMALMSMVPTSLQMQEFHAHQWALRQGWRQVDDNFIYKIRQDGANFEFANDGHENTDQSLTLPFRALARWNSQPTWLDPFWKEEFMDNLLSNTRYWFHNLKQDGFSYRLNARTQRLRYLGQQPEYKFNLLPDERETQLRARKVFRTGPSTESPRVFSESLAFQGYSYLRSGWEPDDYFLYFQAIGQPILSGREDQTGFSLYGDRSILLLCPAPVVDGKTQNAHYGLVMNPGGKAPFATYGKPNWVKTDRFLASSYFDLVESKFEGVYQYHRPSDSYDSFGSYGHDRAIGVAQAQAKRENRPFVDEPIRDTTQHRQVLSIRGRDLYIVTDVYHSRGSRQFTQDFTLYTPVRSDEIQQRLALLAQERIVPLDVDAAKKSLSTHNPGLPNLQLRQFSSRPIHYRVETNPMVETVRAGGRLPDVLKAFNKRDRQQSEQYGDIQFGQKVAATWDSKGDHVLVSLVSPQRRQYTLTPPPPLRDVRTLVTDPDRIGFSATFPDGAELSYIASVRPQLHSIGALQATAAVLLLADSQGVALDCTTLLWHGSAVPLEARDFEFRVENNQLIVGQAIHRPIQPVTILPETAAFIENQVVTLTCPTPGVSIHYTLDGERPTPQSPRYAGPITIGQTTRLKTRAFRNEVTSDLWQQDGTHGTTVFSAVFRKESPAPASNPSRTAAGLRFDYFEAPWTEAMVRSLTYPSKTSGVAPLFDVSMRQTEGAFGVRYAGYLEVPENGVYTFHAPNELTYPDIESGYDLRVFVGDREWYPNVRWHGHGTWSIALEKGRHPFRVVFVDLRPKSHKVELMWGFPHPEFTWKGVAPTLLVSGPGMAKQPLPANWLSH